ncbi:DUF2461 domain-containing protein [Roseibium sp. MMSF_3412]|uniref:DUF2461 domain-containing protein n=1 Tax=Roseibium sp. MMSF_3412 TaxID=3046712 RepID=UPI00273E0B70|nr:DUF2461 domain-containing protein [Roseibium sp. MMSF_3412]
MPSQGFSAETFAFLASLKANNAKEWFDAHKPDYQRFIKKPADALRADLAGQISGLTGHETTSKQFRINRDLRFSKDKTPYNAHIRMAFWPKGKAFEGREAQPPSFFVSFEPGLIRLGTGCMTFSKTALGSYLHALESGSGDKISALLSDLAGKGFERSAPDLAKAPRGFPKNHEHTDLARHKGLAVWTSLADTGSVIGETAASFLVDTWKPTLAFWTWLVDLSTSE